MVRLGRRVAGGLWPVMTWLPEGVVSRCRLLVVLVVAAVVPGRLRLVGRRSGVGEGF